MKTKKLKKLKNEIQLIYHRLVLNFMKKNQQRALIFYIRRTNDKNNRIQFNLKCVKIRIKIENEGYTGYIDTSLDSSTPR